MANAMNSPYKEFNAHVKEFVRELDRTFDVWCFKFMMAGYKMLKSMHKSLPHKYFQEFVYLPHGKGIKQCDETSFFDPAYQPPPLYNNMVESLKGIWKGLDDQTKQTIWKHLNVLCILNERCIEYRKSKNMPPIETVDDANCDD